MSAIGTFVFLHAHPDDEAIFTGGTMAMLARAGHRVILVVATSGELGLPEPGTAPLGVTRMQETRECCEQLGVSDIRFMEYADSGVLGENPVGFAHLDPHAVVDRLEELLADIGAIDALVSYDDHGIYGHPDHLQVHRLAALTATRLEIATVYEATVDREYLHFVETHVVVEAGLGERPIGRGLAASELGMASVMIDVGVDVISVLDAKRSAMAAHASQLPADAPTFALGEQNFAAVYRYEWYCRVGPKSALDLLPQL